MDALLSFIHFIQASIPFFRCSGVEFFIIFSNSGPEAMYSTTNFFIGSSPYSSVDQPTNLISFLRRPDSQYGRGSSENYLGWVVTRCANDLNNTDSGAAAGGGSGGGRTCQP